ncbi:sphingosine-1-phosphate phosphatase 1-like isoform X3 [Carettochelys insculpta]|uniref:sphingosine-1-phosphate phosphatase 1-like isoform X3 n=1 Tax=Carettochelys insculpta TaxID=44489 RepID=UPI003EBC6FF5
MALLQRLARLATYLQDPQKVADFQRLCGVEGPPGWAASPPLAGESGEPEPLANGSCPVMDGGGEGEGGPRPRGGGKRHPNGLGNGAVPGGAGGEAASQQQGEGKQRAWGRRQPRRNSLTGEAACQEVSIGNPFLYYLFSLGTELGNELFYMLFFPFCIWNLDPWVGRRLIIVWVWVMYLGQCTKDVIRWPRPASPPVVKLEVFYNTEYGMPSTHAMSGTAIPLALLLLSYGRWQDVVAGFLYAILILVVFHPAVDLIDNFNLTYKHAPLIIISLHLALGVFSFTLDTWSTSRGDTAQILGCGAGVACGSHFNNMLGLMQDPSPDTLPLIPSSITVTLFGKAILRLLIGVVILLLTRIVMKKITIPLACKMFRISCDNVQQARQRMEVELPYRYITYGMVGFSLMVLVPFLFLFIGLS